MIRAPIDQLQDDGLTHFHFAGSKEELGLGELDFPVEDLAVHLSLIEADRGFFVTAEVEGTGKMRCHRCLDEFEYPLHMSFSALAVIDEQLEREETLEESEDIIHVPARSQFIDATQLVYDGILLELPYKLLCREDCQGLCDQCGQNLNHGTCQCDQDSIDPRWEKLNQLNFEE